MTATVDVLVLGAGWTAQFLLPLLQERGISFSATTRDGRDVAGFKTIPFNLSHDSKAQADESESIAITGAQNDINNQGNVLSESDWKRVPKAKTILITFPINEKGTVTKHISNYEAVYGADCGTQWLQLGSTSAWNDVCSTSMFEQFNGYQILITVANPFLKVGNTPWVRYKPVYSNSTTSTTSS